MRCGFLRIKVFHHLHYRWLQTNTVWISCIATPLRMVKGRPRTLVSFLFHQLMDVHPKQGIATVLDFEWCITRYGMEATVKFWFWSKCQSLRSFDSSLSRNSCSVSVLFNSLNRLFTMSRAKFLLQSRQWMAVTFWIISHFLLTNLRCLLFVSFYKLKTGCEFQLFA